MLYKFRSKAGSDVIMLGPHGDEVLHALGKQSAAQGIIECQDIPTAIAILEKAIAQEETAPTDIEKSADPTHEQPPNISLRQRAWPLLALLRRAHTEGKAVTWG
jgi:hypothetical protein